MNEFGSLRSGNPFPSLYRGIVLALGAWIALGGIGSMILTRELYRRTVPGDFVGDLPTLSKAASVPPGEWVFAVGLGSVGLAIMAAWTATFVYNRGHIARLPPRGRRRFTALAALGLALGLAEGVAVSTIGVVSMRRNLDVHMAGSYVTFIAGALAFLVDSFGTARWRVHLGEPFGRLAVARRALSLAVCVTSLFFLYVFLTKNDNPFGDHYTTRLIYTATEFIVGALSFCYAPLYTAEIAWSGRPGARQSPA